MKLPILLLRLITILDKFLAFHTINHAIQDFFKVNFFGFVDAPVICIQIILSQEVGVCIMQNYSQPPFPPGVGTVFG